uniref:Gamma-tubulin complex component 6 n=1 Tax=Davidia involucrata TaxID=16924 RepID=A0A5B7BZ58_DAVIN
MAVDANFASLFENLKMEDPWLPPRPWESIPSESGLSHFDASTPQSSLSRRLYDTSTVSETSLVRLAMNALYGVESALVSIEKLCAAFCSDPADRTFHRIPSLWNRCLSTQALGNILKSIGRFGFIVFLLRKFVYYFTNLNLGGNLVGNKLENSELVENQDDHDNEVEERLPCSLVNQAFSVAVGKVLEGYICALDTLYTSVSLRRSPKAVDASSHSSSGVGCLTSVVHSEITLLEVYLHTKELRNQIGALGNICNIHDVALYFSVSSFEDLVAKANLEFRNFPRGGDLLTRLYTQLRVADPAHCVLLKFLFLRSCEPYCGFIRSWIYEAKISDPSKEFVVEYMDNPPSYSPRTAGISIDFPLATIREQDGAVPCFLKDYLIPLLRAGQQLQVLMKLLELCNHVGIGNCSYEDIIPCWSDFSSDCPSYASPMTFNKGSIEAMVLARNSYYKVMLKKLESLLAKLEIKQVILRGNVPVFVDNSRGGLNIPFSFPTDESLISPLADRRDSDVAIDNGDSEASSTMDDFSYLEDELRSSECSSLNSSEEQNESEQLIQLSNGLFGPEQKYLSTLNFLPSVPVNNSLQKPSQSDISHPVESDSNKICGRITPPDHFLYFHHEGTNLSNNSLPLESEESNLSQMFETQYTGSQHDVGGLLSGFVKNPFYVDRESRDDTSLHQFERGLKVSRRNMGVLKEGPSNFSSAILNAITEEATDKGQLPNGPCASSNSFILQPWKFKYHSNFLSMNPMLTQNDLMRKPTERFCTVHREPFSCFDFSSVKDPCKVYVENLVASHRHQFGPEFTIFKNSGASAATGISNYHDKEVSDGDEVSIDKSTLSYVNSPMELMDNKHEDVSLANVSGGNGWESMLGCSANTINFSVGDQRKSLAAIFEIPLDFVIKKCLLEEILLQYRYVSKLTIKLLEEGFDLQEHLLALRRYHFMEFADWADLFIMSLWHHKWYVTGADQRISEIQGLLELSVQRSSCERDHNKDRLFVYTKGHGVMPLSTSAIGVHSFDFLGLGYRVDWPISIVLTPGALKIYSEIFSFLIQVKLAVFSLSDVWCSLKDLLLLINQNRHSELHKLEVHHFYILTKLRHQINHFVSTLQQYVQSQLSHVSWCRFLYSLKHKVKDMMDLESVHMAYLTDSLHICFLSNDSRPIASIIGSILQCALDFRSCLIGGTFNARLDGGLLGKLSRINISQVLAIKGTFDKNLKELHLCYLKSPKHGEFGLSHFWGYLNYNEYYSDVTNEISHYAFSV